MLAVVVAMLVILAVCALIAVYAAFPDRGEELPAVPWLGDAMARAADVAPTLDAEDAEEAGARARKH